MAGDDLVQRAVGPAAPGDRDVIGSGQAAQGYPAGGEPVTGGGQAN